MSTIIKSYTLDTNGKPTPLTIEVGILRRLPALVIVGVHSSAARELAEIVRSAIESSGYTMPRQRIVVSVAPADMHKLEPYSLALPIAMGILHASKQVKDSALNYAYIGQLGLAGTVLPSRGMLSIAQPYAVNHTGRSTDELVCPFDVGQLAVDTFGDQGCLLVARTLRHAVELAEGTAPSYFVPASEPDVSMVSYNGALRPRWWGSLDTHDIVLTGPNAPLINALVEAAATRRPVLFQGPAGCGKSMLAARMPGLLGPMPSSVRTSLALIHDRAGLVGSGPYLRPFRAPHHTVSQAGMLGFKGRPGEIELAHEGVLLLDEMHEFPRTTLDALAHQLYADYEGKPRPWIIGSVPDRIGPDDGSETAANMARILAKRVDSCKNLMFAVTGQEPLVLQLPRTPLLGEHEHVTHWPSTLELAERVRVAKLATRELAALMAREQFEARFTLDAKPSDFSQVGMHEPVGGAYIRAGNEPERKLDE